MLSEAGSSVAWASGECLVDWIPCYRGSTATKGISMCIQDFDRRKGNGQGPMPDRETRGHAYNCA